MTFAVAHADRRRVLRRLAGGSLAVTLAGTIGSLAQAARAAAEPAPRFDWRAPEFADVEVLTQQGHKLRFRSGVLAGRTVAVNFIFTSCTTICSPVSAGFAAVQQQLGPRLGRELHLVSVSVDPLNDSPAVLREYGARFAAGPGWTFVTGGRQAIDRILRDFDVPLGGDLGSHTPYVYIGNDAARRWTRVHGLSEPRLIAQALTEAARLGMGAPAATR